MFIAASIGPGIGALCLWVTIYLKNCYVTLPQCVLLKTQQRFRDSNGFDVYRLAMIQLANGILQSRNVINVGRRFVRFPHLSFARSPHSEATQSHRDKECYGRACCGLTGVRKRPSLPASDIMVGLKATDLSSLRSLASRSSRDENYQPRLRNTIVRPLTGFKY